MFIRVLKIGTTLEGVEGVLIAVFVGPFHSEVERTAFGVSLTWLIESSRVKNPEQIKFDNFNSPPTFPIQYVAFPPKEFLQFVERIIEGGMIQSYYETDPSQN